MAAARMGFGEPARPGVEAPGGQQSVAELPAEKLQGEPARLDQLTPRADAPGEVPRARFRWTGISNASVKISEDKGRTTVFRFLGENNLGSKPLSVPVPPVPPVSPHQFDALARHGRAGLRSGGLRISPRRFRNTARASVLLAAPLLKLAWPAACSCHRPGSHRPPWLYGPRRPGSEKRCPRCVLVLLRLRTVAWSATLP